MEHTDFEQLVTDAVNELPDEFKRVLENVVIVIEEEPTQEQREKNAVKPYMELYGLYEGVPRTQRASTLMKLPDKITIFKNPIERTKSTPEEIKEQVRSTVLHEIGHYFGMSEEKLRRIQKK